MLIVPGAALANSDPLAQLADTAFSELVAQNDWVADREAIAQLAVHGTTDAVATLFCLVPIKLTIELLSQKEDVADQEEVTAQLAVIG